MEVPVEWECANYEEDIAAVYTFTPKWDEKAWTFEESGENKVPTIEVTCIGTVPEVSTEEELSAAFAAGVDQIFLKNDIALTKPLVLPATAKIDLDGQGFSLLRGKTIGEDGSGSEFTGVMICMDGEGYTADTCGRLLLKNITINGKTEADHAGAPAIVDKGDLILEKGAVVRDNYNCGTYPEKGEEGVEKILPYGGGIRVYGKLTVMSGSSVTRNYAEERGGGVYLDSGSTLYLYADVIKDNRVGDTEYGFGADLYASAGSTIYFDPEIDMTQEGFYICEGVIWGTQKTPTDPKKKELYINVDKNSGYSDEQVAALKEALRAKGYTILSEKRTEINTTDLRNWYVYDHYDASLWGDRSQPPSVDPPEAWEKEYGGNPRRKYYPDEDPDSYSPPGLGKLIRTIAEWLENLDAFKLNNKLYLAQFKEHIYNRVEDGKSMMTFAGYAAVPYVDFLYYDPESDGEKVVDFDVDSTNVYLHTLLGNGFLVNTGVDGSGNMSGYLVYYKYKADNGVTKASDLMIYRIQDVSVDTLHHIQLQEYVHPTMEETLGTPIQTYPISAWENEMSIQIRVTPTRIVVRQQPKNAETEIEEAEPVCTYEIPEGAASGYSGFGPLVAYQRHDCDEASSFTYSNLRMYYTNPELEKEDMLSPLEKADYTQDGMQKYFVDLFGGSDLNYNTSAHFGQYQEYMKMMQTEGIALVTDRKTPFGEYLGKANGSESNLFELGSGGPLPDPEELAEWIHNSISTKSSTELEDKVAQGALTQADPQQSVGNIWLKSVGTGKQFRTLYGDSFPDTGYEFQVMDDITYYHGSEGQVTPVQYDILKPDGSGYESLGTVGASSGEGIALYGMGAPDGGTPITPGPFTIAKDRTAWPAGSYTVRQRVNKSSIRGYAYFDLVWDGEAPPDNPPEEPDPPAPPQPKPEPEPKPDPPEEPDPPTPPEEPDPPAPPEEPDPPAPPEEPDPPVPPEEPDPPIPPEEPDPPAPPEEPDPPVPSKPKPKPAPPKKSTSSAGEPEPVVYVEEAVEVTVQAPAVTVPAKPAPVPEEPEKDPGEPRTGDLPVPALPVSLGAGTAFMMKIRLWLYELETGISEEKKNEIMRMLVNWAKDTSKFRIYMAIIASAVVLTAYHLLRVLDAKRRQVVAWFER